MYFVITNQLIKCFDFVDIQHIPRHENNEANELAQITLRYKVPKEKLEDLIEVQGKVQATRLSPPYLALTKLRLMDS